MSEPLALLKQYENIKSRHKEEILFFRLGDFYEMFFSDAVEASGILGLTLTKRQNAPMCGVPHHAAKAYIGKLLKAGKKVAICEQLGQASKGRGIIDRGVVELITPGSVVDDDYLDSSANNFLVALGAFGKVLALAWIDASTGEFRAESFPVTELERLKRALYSLAPRELIVRESVLDEQEIAKLIAEHPLLVLNRLPDWVFSIDQGRKKLLDHFKTNSIKGFGFNDNDPALAAAGALLEYIEDALKVKPDHIRALKSSDSSNHVIIDEASQKNLEISKNLRDGSKEYSLLGVLDYTKTAMGSRALRQRLERPLRNPDAINNRLDAVSVLYKEQRALERIRSILASVRDLERLASRLAMDRASPKDLVALKITIEASISLSSALPDAASSKLFLFSDADKKTAAADFAGLISTAISEEPANSPSDGMVIRKGWDAELDRLRSIKADAHSVLEAYLLEEREKNGLPGLKLRYNRILGYYLELSKAASQAAPDHFIRRQSISSGERYTSERLVELESDINSASERIIELESSLLRSVLDKLKPGIDMLFELAIKLAELDCSASLAWAATLKGYVRPIVDNSLVLEVKDGRHPVVEAYMPSSSFIPNSLELDGNKIRFALITGPNMAGKSTFLRQNALIVLMAQAGSFIPASGARIGVVDRIFCRVGAQDNLARGESTFLLEMHETASILNNASPSSLVIMDEVGRGTGTLDGLSIAWAVSEYVLDVSLCRTLFATHYHELTAIKHKSLKDLSMAVEERAGEVVFLRQLVAGPATGSYGIHVAKIAGIPQSVVDRAEEIRFQLEQQEGSKLAASSAASVTAFPKRKSMAKTAELFSAEELVINELRGMDPDKMTPIEALNRLHAIKKTLS